MSEEHLCSDCIVAECFSEKPSWCPTDGMNTSVRRKVKSALIGRQTGYRAIK